MASEPQTDNQVFWKSHIEQQQLEASTSVHAAAAASASRQQYALPASSAADAVIHTK